MMLKLNQANEAVNGMVGKVLDAFDSLDVDSTHAELKQRIMDAMQNRDKVKIVLVGQYSAGKSTIIKMLTGRQDIKIAAGIATDAATSYEWNGLEIIDTPGIDTGLHAEHDEITLQAIREADMVLFVITHDLFFPKLAEDFRRLAFEEHRNQHMVLVVNKMSGTAEGNTPKQQATIKESVSLVTAPLSPDEFYITFLDAQDYLDSLDCDPQDAEELRDASGYDAFVDTLNAFVDAKGTISKLLQPLHVCWDCLAELAADYATDDDGEGKKALQTRMAQAKLALEDFRLGGRRDANALYRAVNHKGELISMKVIPGFDEQTIDADKQVAQQDIDRTVEKAISDLQDRLAENLTMFHIHIHDWKMKESSSFDALSSDFEGDTIDIEVGSEGEDLFSKKDSEASSLLDDAKQGLVEVKNNLLAATPKQAVALVLKNLGTLTDRYYDNKVNMAQQAVEQASKDVASHGFLSRMGGSVAGFFGGETSYTRAVAYRDQAERIAERTRLEAEQSRKFARNVSEVAINGILVVGQAGYDYYKTQKEKKRVMQEKDRIHQEFHEEAQEKKEYFESIVDGLVQRFQVGIDAFVQSAHDEQTSLAKNVERIQEYQKELMALTDQLTAIRA